MAANRGKYNQNHGILIENMVRKTFDFRPQHIDNLWDIPGEFNTEQPGVPISVKATCTQLLCLADARRFWRYADSLQIVAVRYASVDGTTKKVFYEVRTYLLSSEDLDVLRGNTPYEAVELFHNDIHVFGPGEHAAARILAKRRNSMLERVYGRAGVRLNPKIDSKNQRRVQSSVYFDDLAPYLIRTDTVKYRGIHLPVILDMEGNAKK